jgi:alpha-L-fucosidase
MQKKSFKSGGMRVWIIIAIFFLSGKNCFLQTSSTEHKLPVPNKAQLAWQNAALGVLFDYDLHVFDSIKYVQRIARISPVPDYQIFHPDRLDTDQWIRAAKAMGAKFALLTVTHETGFALYQSDVNPFCLKAVKWRNGKGDIVRDFVNSCRKFGLKPGLYIGIRWNSFFGVHNFKVQGEGKFRENRQVYYNQMVEGMVKELCTRYGELFEIWFDGGADSPERGAPDVLPIVKKYQPNALFYHNSQLAEARWGGSESGTVPYPCWATFPYPSTDGIKYPEIVKDHFALLKRGDPDGNYWMPAMSDAPLRGFNGRHEWFWEPGDEANIFPLANLVDMYYKSVGRNSTLILGLTPDPTGLLPQPDVKRVEEFGIEIERRFSSPVIITEGKGRKIEIKFATSTKINQVSIREGIERGERIRKFVLEGWSGGKWVEILEGTCIGHKFIRTFPTVTVDNIRLRIEDAVGDPEIRNMSVYYIQGL